MFPTRELASICCASDVPAFHEQYHCFLSDSLMFIMVVSDKQLRFAAMDSPASRIPTCAAWLSVARAAARRTAVILVLRGLTLLVRGVVQLVLRDATNICATHRNTE